LTGYISTKYAFYGTWRQPPIAAAPSFYFCLLVLFIAIKSYGGFLTKTAVAFLSENGHQKATATLRLFFVLPRGSK